MPLIEIVTFSIRADLNISANERSFNDAPPCSTHHVPSCPPSKSPCFSTYSLFYKPRSNPGDRQSRRKPARLRGFQPICPKRGRKCPARRIRARCAGAACHATAGWVSFLCVQSRWGSYTVLHGIPVWKHRLACSQYPFRKIVFRPVCWTASPTGIWRWKGGEFRCREYPAFPGFRT